MGKEINQDKKYFAFPITMLRGFMDDTKGAIRDISSFALYHKTRDFENAPNYDNSNPAVIQAVFQAAEYYGRNIFADPRESLKNGFQINKQVKGHVIPYTAISVSMARDFAMNDKSDFEKITLLAFLALKSIAGNDNAYKTNKQMLYSRMAGQIKPVGRRHGTNFEIYEDEYFKTLPSNIAEWYEQKRFYKIKKALMLNWGLVYYSYHFRGFYFSFKLSIENLVKHAESNRVASKLKEIEEATKEARIKAIKELYPLQNKG